MRNIEKIFDRLYQKLEIEKDKIFCEKYGIKQNTLSTWKKRNSIPYELILEIAEKEDISIDYILKGKENNKREIILNYKEENIKNLENLNEKQQEYIYHLIKAELAKEI